VVARVVRYGRDGEVRFSWHGDLSRRDGEEAELAVDDGETFSVVVGNGLLKLAHPQASYDEASAPTT
jgi:hypothetical protein